MCKFTIFTALFAAVVMCSSSLVQAGGLVAAPALAYANAPLYAAGGSSQVDVRNNYDGTLSSYTTAPFNYAGPLASRYVSGLPAVAAAPAYATPFAAPVPAKYAAAPLAATPFAAPYAAAPYAAQFASPYATPYAAPYAAAPFAAGPYAAAPFTASPYAVPPFAASPYAAAPLL